VTTVPRSAERRIVAYLDQESSANPIHSGEAATSYGYRGALVAGVVVYGWAVPSIIDVLGERWLADGWVEMAFRRPTYAGDEVAVRVTEGAGGAFDLAVTNPNGDRCVAGTVGTGRAPWYDELHLPQRRAPEPSPEPRPQLTLADAPLGEELRPMAIAVTVEEAAEQAESVRDAGQRWSGDGALMHPAWVAGRMYRLLQHSYEFSPSMHVRSQIQHVAPVEAGQTIVAAARFDDAYERKGHHYATLRGALFAEDGRELARMRYSTVFHIEERA
jgi:acyl dehydratase